MSEQLRNLLRELRSRLEAFYGPRLVRLMLFGSQARIGAEAGSDIDLLVVLEGPVSPGKGIARAGEITAGISLATLPGRRTGQALPLRLVGGRLAVPWSP